MTQSFKKNTLKSRDRLSFRCDEQIDLKYSYFKNQFKHLLKPEWHALMNKYFLNLEDINVKIKTMKNAIPQFWF